MRADEHEAGRALDRLVGERVMGYTVRREDTPGWSGRFYHSLHDRDGSQVYYWSGESQGTIVTCMDEDELWSKCCPPFSTSIEDAWRVVERMRQHKGFGNLQMIAYSYNRTYATFTSGFHERDDWCEANGEHATPVAICLAALEACPEGEDVWRPDGLT